MPARRCRDFFFFTLRRYFRHAMLLRRADAAIHAAAATPFRHFASPFQRRMIADADDDDSATPLFSLITPRFRHCHCAFRHAIVFMPFFADFYSRSPPRFCRCKICLHAAIRADYAFLRRRLLSRRHFRASYAFSDGFAAVICRRA